MKDQKTIMAKYPNINIAVIGDICLDIYYFITDEKSEISVETGLKTRPVYGFKHTAGGAGNVAVNMKTLGAGRVDLYGVIGKDPYGNTLKELLEDSEVNCNYICVQETGWHTHVYHKVYKDGKEEPRYDIGNFNKAEEDTINALIKDLESGITGYQAVVINEQITQGYHNEAFQTALNKIIEKYEDKCIWITDSRHLNNKYNRTIRKLNIHEALEQYHSCNGQTNEKPENSEVLKWLHSRWGKSVVITLGEDGAVAVDNEGKLYTAPGINIIGPTDTVGAGDAFLAGFALTLSSGGTMEEALHMGNLSAAVSVTKLFETGHPKPEEIVNQGDSPDYRYNPELVKDKRKALYLENTQIEVIDQGKRAFPKVAIFDHDGTISTLRQGWEPIMKEVCINAVLGDSINTASTEELTAVENTVDELIEKTTGIQTIIQMHYLRDMVISFGYVPPNKIRVPLEYKEIYNNKLLEMVSKRVDLFRKDILDLRDVTIKGAVEFLQMLESRGVKLYLASGTDQEDVRKEADLLGYGNYCSGGIFGSVGNVSKDPKRVVIENIIKQLPSNISPEECYIFGDGPVEMREAAKRGFTRIGLVSDEKQRFGINGKKRSRLILGGAQILIPDFSWIKIMGEYLGWEKN